MKPRGLRARHAIYLVSFFLGLAAAIWQQQGVRTDSPRDQASTPTCQEDDGSLPILSEATERPALLRDEKREGTSFSRPANRSDFEIEYSREMYLSGQAMDPITISPFGVKLPDRVVPWDEQTNEVRQRQLLQLEADLEREFAAQPRPWSGKRFQAISLLEEPCSTTIGAQAYLVASPSASVAWHEEYRGQKLPRDVKGELIADLTRLEGERFQAVTAVVSRIVELGDSRGPEDGALAYALVNGFLNIVRPGDSVELDALLAETSELTTEYVLARIGEILER